MDFLELENSASSQSLETKLQELSYGISFGQKVLRSKELEDESNTIKPRTQHHLSFTASNEHLFENIKLAFVVEISSATGATTNNNFIIPTPETAAVLKHMEGIKPINEAIRAFQKRRTKGSAISLSGKDGGRSSISGFGSNLSLNDFYGSNSNLREKSSSKSSLKKDSIRKYQPSPRTVQQKLLLLDHRIIELQQESPHQALDSLPLERLGDNEEIKKRRAVISKFRMKKFNSTSTLFLDSCLVNSNLEEYLKYFSFYIQNIIRTNYENDSFKSFPGPDILSEKVRPLSKHIQFYKKPVSKKDIFRYLECMFQSAELGVENVLITIIYIKRMLRKTAISIQQINWARIILGAVILASKVWDDHAIWNIDFTQIFPEVPVADMNELESFYLSALEYNVNVKPSMYAQIFFELRDSCAFHYMPWALSPLKISERKRLLVSYQIFSIPQHSTR